METKLIPVLVHFRRDSDFESDYTIISYPLESFLLPVERYYRRYIFLRRGGGDEDWCRPVARNTIFKKLAKKIAI
jgi:hypothetical protein